MPVQVNPDGVMSKVQEDKFRSLVQSYDEVFNPEVTRYNGKSGRCEVEVNMGPVPPPQHKGRVPFYGRSNLVELQDKFDVLVKKGVFKRPQDIGISVEVINPSFLVKKRSSSGMRLVTDFGAIANYCRPTPTLMPDVDSALRAIAAGKVVIKTDLVDAYYGLTLSRKSLKYCGVVSPMKGVFVYTAGAMGLPGTEVALEELTCLLFGEMVKQGKVVKLADDFFIIANDYDELYSNFEEVLGILAENNVKLSAKKTIIAPKSVMVLGWIWNSGFLKASPHILSALSECDPPSTFKALKSFIGAYRHISRVIEKYASLLKPLEAISSGKSAGNLKIVWSDSQLDSFKAAQAALKSAKSIVLPRRTDILQIVTDAAVLPAAIGATMYAIRDKKTLLAGFYNAKLPLYQTRWLPCELEGVAIGAALIHFAPYLRMSIHKPQVLTDSKACCQAVEKMSRGEYSASSRLCTFLSSVARFQAVVQHIQGSNNVSTDYISRNPIPCNEPRCQVCSFLKESMSSVVNAVTVSDVLEGSVQLPFTNKRSWIEIQEECPDLRQVFKFIRNGTTPGKKGRNLRMVKRYISSKVVISSEGALVVRQVEPFNPTSERIVVPHNVLHGILTVLHLKLNHPSSYQLSKVFNRFFFALNLEKYVSHCSDSCHQCTSLKDVPKALRQESTDPPPTLIGQRFAADVIKRNKQLILLLRECVSSYTQAELIPNETASEIADSLLRLSNVMRPSKLMPMKIRLDPHPSHRSLLQQVKANKGLATHGIDVELGRELNLNKNPVAECAVRELIREILCLFPDGGKISSTGLSEAVACLNSKLRAPGLSAHEVFTQRDQTSGLQLSMDDLKLINDQFSRRTANHSSSERCKSHGKPPHPLADISVGSIVYLYDDRSKLTARPRYLVLSIKDEWCTLKRFSDKRVGIHTYKAKLSECYAVPADIVDSELPPYPNYDDDDEEVCVYQDNPSIPVTPDVVHKPDIQTEEEEASGGEEYPCSVCEREVLDDDLSLTCDSCGKWCHLQCGGLSDRAYRQIARAEKKEEVEDYKWDCPACKPADQ